MYHSRASSKLNTYFYQIAQLCLVFNCVVAKTENRFVRLRPIDNYEHNAVYTEDHTITVFNVFIWWDLPDKLCFTFITSRNFFVKFKL